ncbi:hypothetical protein [Bdellovibrio sp. HCB337]|uniref:hypothetical protein n=1 Tax=Bdellovibrio sp. HCB337 TaxID=3394358 RepID=UPI0039A533D6
MKVIRFWLFSLILLLGFAVLAADPKSFLQEQKKIRIYVDSAPGFGHQSAGISVMRRLRELGFQGEFEVVYQASVAAKIKKIYPGFPDGIENEVKYLSTEEYQNARKQGKIEKLKLAMSGADDGFGSEFARVSMAETYLRLQPLGWGSAALYEKNARVLFTLQDLPLTNLQSPEADQFVETLKNQTDLPEDKKQFALKFADIAQNHLSFPVYGVGIQAFAPQKVYFYAKAVKSAAQRMSSDKAVIIPVVSPFNADEMDTVKKVFGKVEGFEAAATTERKHQNQMHLLTPQEFSALEKLKPGNLYFVFVGSVPQNVFNFFYESANLPVWVAGKNAMSFAATKGKVYLNTVDDYHLPGREKLSAEANKKLERALVAFNNGYQEYANQGYLTALSQFIQESSTPGTELQKFYSGIGEKLSANDKVLEGLRNVIGTPSIHMCRDIF